MWGPERQAGEKPSALNTQFGQGIRSITADFMLATRHGNDFDTSCLVNPSKSRIVSGAPIPHEWPEQLGGNIVIIYVIKHRQVKDPISS